MEEVAFEPDVEQIIHTAAQLNLNSHVLYMSRHWVRGGCYCRTGVEREGSRQRLDLNPGSSITDCNLSPSQFIKWS